MSPQRSRVRRPSSCKSYRRFLERGSNGDSSDQAHSRSAPRRYFPLLLHHEFEPRTDGAAKLLRVPGTQLGAKDPRRAERNKVPANRALLLALPEQVPGRLLRECLTGFVFRGLRRRGSLSTDGGDVELVPVVLGEYCGRWPRGVDYCGEGRNDDDALDGGAGRAGAVQEGCRAEKRGADELVGVVRYDSDGGSGVDYGVDALESFIECTGLRWSSQKVVKHEPMHVGMLTTVMSSTTTNSSLSVLTDIASRMLSPLARERTVPRTEKPCSRRSLMIQAAMNPFAPVTRTFPDATAGILDRLH